MTFGGYTNTRTVTNPYGTRVTLPTRDERLAQFPSSAPAPAPTATPGLTSDQQSARAIINSTLQEFGLTGLADRLWNQFIGGTPIEQIFLDLRETPEYNARFAGMAALRKKGRAISERAYIELERTYTEIARSYGLPSGFYDSPDDFANAIGGEMSPKEYSDRLAGWRAYADEMASDPDNAAQVSTLERYYGIRPSDGEFLAFVMDDKRALPILQRQIQAGILGSRAERSGFGALSVGEAERIAATGIDPNAATDVFGELVRSRELFGALDAGETDISRDTQFDAAFGGSAQAQEEIRRRAERRAATTKGGGQFATSREGFSGIGEAS